MQMSRMSYEAFMDGYVVAHNGHVPDDGLFAGLFDGVPTGSVEPMMYQSKLVSSHLFAFVVDS